VVSNRAYRGVNTLTLWAAAEEKGFCSNMWATFRQWKSLGGYVQRGEKGTRIIYWNVVTETVIDRDTGDETEERRFFAREFHVFNVEQTGGVALDRFRVTRPVREFTDFQAAEDAFAATGADIRHGGNRAYYDLNGDFIRLPIKEAFESEASYYSTLAHEEIHWCGAPHRLDRLDRLARFGDKSYAAEELVAELGGAFLTAAVGIPNERTLEDSAAYLGDWLSVLQSDSKAIFTAATAASEAAEYILSFSEVEEAEELEEVPF